MADYASLKVPDLKKLLQEKSLPVTGNKADLIARLQEHDKSSEQPKPVADDNAEDVIDYSDDDVAAPPKAVAPSTAIETSIEEPTTEVEPTDTTTTATQDPVAETIGDNNGTETAVAEDTAAIVEEAPKTDFSAHLPASMADDEARKRAERAKRFGTVAGTAENGDKEDEAKKLAARAERFGADESLVPKGLDAALPERRERKRGREGGDQDRGSNKRQQNGGGNGGGRGRDRDGGRRRHGRGGGRGGGGGDRDRGAPRRDGGGGGRANGGAPRSILSDPSEKAKAEARAKRFGGAT